MAIKRTKIMTIKRAKYLLTIQIMTATMAMTMTTTTTR